MSSSDDWEKDVDSENEETQKKKEQEAAKANADFSDEDTVDAEEKKKQLAKEEAERRAKELEENKRTKKSNKVDYDQKFAERQAILNGIKPSAPGEETKDTAGMSKGGKGMILEMEAEKGLTDQLFGGMDESTVQLSSEKEYKNFGVKTAKVLYAGSAPYRIENFFRELCRDLPEHCASKQMQKIIDHLQIKQKELAKKEKEARDGKNKKSTKAKLTGGGGKSAHEIVGDQQALINDVMGGDYGDEYGEEGGFKREDEAEFDFM